MSVTLTNAERKARLPSAILGVDGEKVRFGLNSTPAPGRKWTGRARHIGYTRTDLAEELVGAKAYYDADSETGQHLKAAGYTVVDWFYDAGRFSLLP